MCLEANFIGTGSKTSFQNVFKLPSTPLFWSSVGGGCGEGVLTVVLGDPSLDGIPCHGLLRCLTGLLMVPGLWDCCPSPQGNPCAGGQTTSITVPWLSRRSFCRAPAPGSCVVLHSVTSPSSLHQRPSWSLSPATTTRVSCARPQS